MSFFFFVFIFIVYVNLHYNPMWSQERERKRTSALRVKTKNFGYNWIWNEKEREREEEHTRDDDDEEDDHHHHDKDDSINAVDLIIILTDHIDQDNEAYRAHSCATLRIEHIFLSLGQSLEDSLAHTTDKPVSSNRRECVCRFKLLMLIRHIGSLGRTDLCTNYWRASSWS